MIYHGNLRLLQEVAFEVTSLHSEGYFLVTETNWRTLVYCKLKHRANGNTIDIFGYPERNIIEIKKNGKVIKTVNVQNLTKV